MKKVLLAILISTTAAVSSAQLPDCVREKCDRILLQELGEEMYSQCIDFSGFEYKEKRDPLINYTCESESSHSYKLTYTFRFPEQEKASFKLGFLCYGKKGKMRIESAYFSRPNQSDLPPGFKEKGLKIVDYKKAAKKASKIIAKKAPEKSPMRWEGGALVLTQDKIVWVFSKKEPYRDPSGFGDEAMISHTVWVNPYSGKVIADQTRRE